jgi:TolB-like protein/Tfp pilus assembly protein PilF
VFLSYASQDAEAAQKICDALHAAGIEVWFDKSELRGGDAWDQRIRRQIKDCALFIPVISTSTEARTEGYFRLEWRLAEQRSHLMAKSRVFFVPVCIDGTREDASDVPEPFLHVQWTRLPGGEVSASFLEHIARLVSRDRSEPARAASATATAGHSRVLPQIPQKSVAVLPLANLSPDKDNEYFTDGLTEEILNILSKVPELYVPGRSSSFYFKGKSAKTAEVAQELNVANVLEGSVRRSGDRLRVSVQLVRANSGYQEWSETYDRQLHDVFSIQDEIANAVVQALQITLSGGPLRRDQGGTSNLEAYQLYLRGVSGLHEMSATSGLEAIAHLERATGLDPNFGLAWSCLGAVTGAQAIYGMVPTREGFERSTRFARHAIALSPLMALPHVTMAITHLYYDWDWAAAEAETRRALELNARLPEASMVASLCAAIYCRWEEAQRAIREALRFDPLNPVLHRVSGFVHYRAGQFAESDTAIRKMIELAPNAYRAHAQLAKIALLQGQFERAMHAAELETDSATRLAFSALALHALGRAGEANAHLDELIARHPHTHAFLIAMNFAYRQNLDPAFEWLERAVRQKESWLANITGDPLLENLVKDPRYRTCLREMHLPE